MTTVLCLRTRQPLPRHGLTKTPARRRCNSACSESRPLSCRKGAYRELYRYYSFLHNNCNSTCHPIAQHAQQHCHPQQVKALLLPPMIRSHEHSHKQNCFVLLGFMQARLVQVLPKCKAKPSAKQCTDGQLCSLSVAVLQFDSSGTSQNDLSVAEAWSAIYCIRLAIAFPPPQQLYSTVSD